MISIHDDLATARTNAEADLIDTGGSAGWINIYKGVPPASLADPIVPPLQDLICQIMYDFPAYGDAVMVGTEAQALLNSPPRTGTVFNGGGEATFYRAFDSNGTAWWQGTVSGPGGDGELELAKTDLLEATILEIS